MKIGEFNLGIREGGTVSIHFDEKFNTFYFQGKLPNNFVWLKTMRLFTAIEKEGFDRESLGNASTFASIVQQNRLGAKYGFEIHVHTYFINKILPEMLRHDFGGGIKRANEYQDAIKDAEGQLNRAKTAAMNTQGTQIGKAYASNYEEAREDYEALTKEWQEIAQKYQHELQELNHLAARANAVIFTISLSSDVKIVPDGSAVALALSECLDELNMRCETILKDAYLQHFSFREVRQPYFFFMTEIAGMFNPSMLALKASDPYFLELFKGLFPALNAASVLQSNLENMRHLQSLAPSEILRKTLLQMEIGTPTLVPPTAVVSQQGVTQGDYFKREDYLTDGVLIGYDRVGGEVRLPFKTLDKHIMVEGVTMSGKSQFAKLLATEAIKHAGMKVIVLDITWGWTQYVKIHNGIIFDRKINMEEALKHDFSLCVIEEDNLESAEQNFMKPFYDYIIQERLKTNQKGKDILLIIDETHKFSKKSKSGELVNLATQIAKYGVILMFVTQRSEQLNIHARSQTTLQFIALTQDDYYRSKADIHSKEWTRAMQNIKKYNLFVHGAEIQFAFELKTLYFVEYPKLSPEEYNQYLYKPQPEKETATHGTQAGYAPKLEIKEPEKPKDELSEIEWKAVEALKANGGMFDSSSKWFKAIGIEKTGETTQKIELSLEKKGYVVFEKINPTKKIIRLVNCH